MKTEDIDAEVVGRHALAVKGIDAACLAEEMARGHCVESILGQRVFARKQAEPAFVHLDHQCVLAPTNRTVACRQLGEVCLDLESDRATMTTAAIPLHWTAVH